MIPDTPSSRVLFRPQTLGYLQMTRPQGRPILDEVLAWPGAENIITRDEMIDNIKMADRSPEHLQPGFTEEAFTCSINYKIQVPRLGCSVFPQEIDDPVPGRNMSFKLVYWTRQRWPLYLNSRNCLSMNCAAASG